MASSDRARGFTLLELLLVLAIIGILAATVSLAVSDTGLRHRIQSEAERVALAVELARIEALTRNEVWGLSIGSTEYAFQTYDAARDAWRTVEEPPFLPRDLEQGMFLEAHTDNLGRDVEERDAQPPPVRSTGRKNDDAVPDIAILPGGEVTPFEIVVSSGDLPAWSARSDGIARVLATPQGALDSTAIRDR